QYGSLSASTVDGAPRSVSPQATKKALISAIRLNPRLADFEADTKFDGVDEPLSQAPALRHVLPTLMQEKGPWLEKYVKVYRRHAKLYEKDVTKGIKEMLRDLKSMEKKATKRQDTNTIVERGATLIMSALLALVASSFLLDCLALAKPIF